jgi:hypothetical protein
MLKDEMAMMTPEESMCCDVLPSFFRHERKCYFSVNRLKATLNGIVTILQPIIVST